jgi:hypothetical protein
VVDEGQVHFDALVHRGLGEALGHPITMGLVGDLLADLGKVILAVGVLDVRKQLGALAHEVAAQ